MKTPNVRMKTPSVRMKTPNVRMKTLSSGNKSRGCRSKSAMVVLDASVPPHEAAKSLLHVAEPLHDRAERLGDAV